MVYGGEMMGLDQYANKVNKKGNKTEIAYWRKHPNLQGWMENLYREKGGTKEFNCIDLELDKNDIDRLEIDINNNDLPTTMGFFFGEHKDCYYKAQDLEFCKDARKTIQKEQTVIYGSWY
tara:strand:- start:466 stop:825 length:360 start_codon:yes stop_codon:yes gene_type:complete